MHINVYLEERNPAAGEERGGKSLSIQPGTHKFNSPDHVKSFCTQTKGSFGVYSSPPDWGRAEGLPAFGSVVQGVVKRFIVKRWIVIVCTAASTELSSWMSWFILLDPNHGLD